MTMWTPWTSTNEHWLRRFALGLLLTFPMVVSGDWPQFRGPTGQGHAEGQPPTHWSETENITWKTAIPGEGWSSPVTSGSQVWLTTATDENRSLRTLCVDAHSGEIRQDVEVFRREAAEHVHSQNSHATPTPVIDEDRVYVHFGRNGTACLSREGEIVWTTQKHDYSTPHGSACSPVVARDLVILCCDGADNQFVVALDKHTGKVRWRQTRTHLEDARRKSVAEDNPERKGLPFISFSTPLVIDVDGEEVLVSTPADHVVANRVRDGQEIWWFPYNCFSLVARPVWGHGLIYAIGGLRDGHYAMYAIRPGSQGQVADADLAWKRTVMVPQVPSPLLVGDNLVLVKDNGIVTCLDPQQGREKWRQRIGGNYRSSPIDANGLVYACNQSGRTSVFRVAPQFSLVASNDLNGIFLASPAVSGRALYMRSDKHLYRIESLSGR